MSEKWPNKKPLACISPSTITIASIHGQNTFMGALGSRLEVVKPQCRAEPKRVILRKHALNQVADSSSMVQMTER